MEKQKANQDTTYCTCKNCDNKCWRHEDNFEFGPGYYSFMEHCLEFLERSCQNGNKIK